MSTIVISGAARGIGLELAHQLQDRGEDVIALCGMGNALLGVGRPAEAVRSFRKHRRVLQQVSLRSRTSQDSSFRERVLALNVELHDLLRGALRRKAGEIGHPDPERAMDLALTAVSGAMREYVLFDEYRPQFEPIEDGRLIEELVDLFCSYLRIAS